MAGTLPTPPESTAHGSVGRFDRIEGKVDTLASEVAELREGGAELRGYLSGPDGHSGILNTISDQIAQVAANLREVRTDIGAEVATAVDRRFAQRRKEVVALSWRSAAWFAMFLVAVAGVIVALVARGH